MKQTTAPISIPFSNFTSFRPSQVQALEFLKQSRKKLVCISGPTGVGKSLIGMMIPDTLSFNNCVYCCTSKYLQQQIKEDFPEVSVIMGRNNYACNLDESLTADDCTARHKNDCPYWNECNYRLAKKQALENMYRVLNIYYFLFEANYVGMFSNQDVLIIDEADTLENILVSFVSLSLSKRYLQSLGISSHPYRKTKWETYVPWLSNIERKLIEKKNKLQEIIKDVGGAVNVSPGMQKELARLYRTIVKIEWMKPLIDASWIYLETPTHMELRPVWLNRAIVDRFLFSHADQIVFMSATLPPKRIVSKIFDIEQEDIDYIELPCPFEIDRRKVIYEPVGAISRKTVEGLYDALAKKVDEIVEKHKGERILVHSVSYALGMEVYKRMKTRTKLIHTTDTKNETVEQYLSTPGSVLISPDMVRGVSLNDDKCRVIIWLKVPFPYLGDKVVSERYYSGQAGKLWYSGEAAHAIVQGVGRGMRHSEDWCITYILDGQFERLIRTPDLFPAWFREAIVW